MNEPQRWPNRLWIVRHGKNAGNVARDAAEHPVIDIPMRDADVPLSALGERQALGRWFGRQPPEEQPTVILAFPYKRARQTAAIALDAAGLAREHRGENHSRHCPQQLQQRRDCDNCI